MKRHLVCEDSNSNQFEELALASSKNLPTSKIKTVRQGCLLPYNQPVHSERKVCQGIKECWMEGDLENVVDEYFTIVEILKGIFIAICAKLCTQVE